MHDLFLLQNKKFSIVGADGGGLFHPQDYDLQPLPPVTSCWRGYVCTYKISNDKLLLDSVQINLDHEGPPINNAHPVFSSRDIFDNIYNEINLQMDFTGGILVAEGFIQKLYVHMGFHPAWKFETVFELTFSQGALLDTQDVSQQMAELRDRMTRQPPSSGPDAFR